MYKLPNLLDTATDMVFATAPIEGPPMPAAPVIALASVPATAGDVVLSFEILDTLKTVLVNIAQKGDQWDQVESGLLLIPASHAILQRVATVVHASQLARAYDPLC